MADNLLYGPQGATSKPDWTHTMTPAEEAEWERAMQSGQSPHAATVGTQIQVPTITTAPTRRRAYTVDELEELFAEWQSQNPNHRDGFEFLMWVRKR